MPSRSRPVFVRRIARIARELGIPADYATSRGLTLQRETRRLVAVGRATDDGKMIRLSPAAATAWKRMHASAADDGIALLPLSGFRSVVRQALLIRRKLKTGESIETILRLVAAPGYSEHHTGRALDIGSGRHAELTADFARTGAFRWLRRNARRFGFHLSYRRGNSHGIAYEPWHWCWHP